MSSHAAERNASAGAPTGRPCVLLVDDESAIRMAMTRYFSRRGWDILEAADGDSARRLLEPNAGGSFDLVLCDLNMPHFSGRDLYRWLSTVRPDAAQRIVFASGDIDSAESRQFVLESRRPMLPKPFELAELDRIIDRLSPNAHAA
jgi:DNA-binding response OmpR family regulator